MQGHISLHPLPLSSLPISSAPPYKNSSHKLISICKVSSSLFPCALFWWRLLKHTSLESLCLCVTLTHTLRTVCVTFSATTVTTPSRSVTFCLVYWVRWLGGRLTLCQNRFISQSGLRRRWCGPSGLCQLSALCVTVWLYSQGSRWLRYTPPVQW